jgi:predicted short-subunit dehydrogenase-like oxidoreductase (DUF2520 family)
MEIMDLTDGAWNRGAQETMETTPTSRPGRVGIIGAGRAGSLFARALEHAGDDVTLGRAGDIVRAGARRVVLAVPDDAVDDVVAELLALSFEASGALVVLLSGSAPLERVSPLAEQGASIVRVHPLLAITPDAAPQQLVGTTAAVTGVDGDAVDAGRAFARRVGMEPFELQDDARGAWHAAATMAANLPVALLALARDLAVEAGLDEATALRAMGGLARRSIEAAIQQGPERALTGPASRGDAGTVAAHVTTLRRSAPAALAAYEACTVVAVRLAQDAGRLDEARASRVLDAVHGAVST